MKTSPASWAKWLNDHKTYDTYNTHPSKTQDICNETESIANFEKLTSCKNIVLLTKTSTGAKCQAPFWYSTVGIQIIPDDLHYVARVGLKTGTCVELQPMTLFTSTSSKKKPDLVSMTKLSSKVGFEAIKADGKATKRKFKCFTVLPPALAKSIQSTDMTYSAIFIEVVKQIKIGATPETPEFTPNTASASSASTTAPTPAPTPPGTENELLLKMATPFDSFLYFLWACHHLDKDVKVPIIVNLQDDVTLEWERATQDQCLGTPKPPVTFDLSGSNPSPELSAVAISTMIKISASMIKHQEVTLKPQEETGDNRMKAWRR